MKAITRRTLAPLDHGVTTRWQHSLATRVIIQALRDLRNRQGLLEHQASAREFLAGSPMLQYWCDVGGLDIRRITTLAQKR